MATYQVESVCVVLGVTRCTSSFHVIKVVAKVILELHVGGHVVEDELGSHSEHLLIGGQRDDGWRQREAN